MYRNIKVRICLLKAMNDIVLSATNDEGLIEWWLEECIPDCPSVEDFEYIAIDTELFELCRKIFTIITLAD